MTWLTSWQGVGVRCHRCLCTPHWLPNMSWLLSYCHVSVRLLLWNIFPLWHIMFQPPSAHHTHSFLLKASLTFNALQVDLLDRSGRLLCLFEAVLHVAMEGSWGAINNINAENKDMLCSLTIEYILFVYCHSTTLCLYGWTHYMCLTLFLCIPFKTLSPLYCSVRGATEGCIHALSYCQRGVPQQT